ncbi:MAG: PIN domain-containing protein [Syntrophaceae bacterium]|nr:PIN domain-containing protein [Syntrophaceae bacterium]
MPPWARPTLFRQGQTREDQNLPQAPTRLGEDPEKKNRQEWEAFLNSPRVELLPHDLETAAYHALIVKRLKARGRPIPTNDIWVAANAMKHGLALYSFDRHFEEIEGLLLFPGNIK